jgi:hypothetical protein
MQKLVWRLKLVADFGEGSATDVEVGRIERLISRHSAYR